MNLKQGHLAEHRACLYLENLGFKIIVRNFYTRYGEIDIIAIDNNTLHFIEVKSGNSFHPSYNLTNRKLERILKSVDIFLSDNESYSSFYISIDLITIFQDEVEFIENITL